MSYFSVSVLLLVFMRHSSLQDVKQPKAGGVVFGQQNACLGELEFNPQQPHKIARHGGIALVTPAPRRQPRNSNFCFCSFPPPQKW